ncbi:MAG: TetR/AcrR family transcriptional regulator [Allosphingosinicella sp.]|uniref:TetR/AcrR family transcriptional regulator n=1 Tax=Allosphingosinicella sp. TaxID=2823234 RepID=UPI003961C0AC
MPRLSTGALEERRQHIIDAAMRLFARNGFHRTTMRDIFEEAGLSAGAVYNYFKSKEDIFEAAVRTSQTRSEQVIGEALDPAATGDAFASAVDIFFGDLAAQSGGDMPRAALIILAEALVNPRLGKIVQGNRAHNRVAIRRLVEARKAADPSWANLPEPVLTEMLLAIFQGLVVALALGEAARIDEIRGVLKRLTFSAS